ncbi:MAG: DUF3179 domain-containing protein [Candidatus Woesearchaeota archaeon]|jgi:hypothetical protein|nr:DUF3179 domain-containing protein [Candidatus Woesearchaeota archaeon]
MKWIYLLLVFGSIFLVACAQQISTPSAASSSSSDNQEQELGEISPIDSRVIQTTSDGTKFIVNPSKIRGGGPPKDGIPSIDNPKYVTVAEADEWIQDNELVLAMIHKGVKRVYPLQILVWHEIVNDVIAGDPILVTYCPLCGSGIAYEGQIDGERVEFGTSGKLFNSNLVMYDRKTDTYWQQIDGLAIVGELTGRELTEVSIDTVTWRDWKKVHPDSEVLSQDTGHSRAYGRDPYGSYYEDSYLIFPVENEDDRIHPKDVIFGIEVDGVHKAYREEDLKREGKIEDNVNNIPVIVERDEAGIVKITNSDSGEEIVKERDFWFAWYAFHPSTLLFGG